MIRRTTMMIAALALAGCGSKNSGEQGGAKATPIQHGTMEGKGTGGGEKSASGTKDGVKGSGKPVDAATATAPGSGSGSAGAALVERGAYVAAIGGCGVCHMTMGPQGPDPSRALAGGLEMTEKAPPFTWRASNITPDEDTGIGAWTDEQIAVAIRQGTRPDGTRLAPIMPSALYNRMTDDDVHALVAYLRSLPPVSNKVERVDNSKLTAAMPPIPAPRNEPVAPIRSRAARTCRRSCTA